MSRPPRPEPRFGGSDPLAEHFRAGEPAAPRPEFRAALRAELLGGPPTPMGWRLPLPGGRAVFVPRALGRTAVVFGAIAALSLMWWSEASRRPGPGGLPVAVDQSAPTPMRLPPPAPAVVQPEVAESPLSAVAPTLPAAPPEPAAVSAASVPPAAPLPAPVIAPAAVDSAPTTAASPSPSPPAPVAAAQAPERERRREAPTRPTEAPATPTEAPAPVTPTEAPTELPSPDLPPATSTPIIPSGRLPTVTPPPPEPPF